MGISNCILGVVGKAGIRCSNNCCNFILIHRVYINHVISPRIGKKITVIEDIYEFGLNGFLTSITSGSSSSVMSRRLLCNLILVLKLGEESTLSENDVGLFAFP